MTLHPISYPRSDDDMLAMMAATAWRPVSANSAQHSGFQIRSAFKGASAGKLPLPLSSLPPAPQKPASGQRGAISITSKEQYDMSASTSAPNSWSEISGRMPQNSDVLDLTDAWMALLYAVALSDVTRVTPHDIAVAYPDRVVVLDKAVNFRLFYDFIPALLPKVKPMDVDKALLSLDWGGYIAVLPLVRELDFIVLTSPRSESAALRAKKRRENEKVLAEARRWLLSQHDGFAA